MPSSCAPCPRQDEGALRLLYERHAGWLHARLRRRCSDAEVVLDVLQDTFVAAWSGADRFRGEAEVAAWLWGIAIAPVGRAGSAGAGRLQRASVRRWQSATTLTSRRRTRCLLPWSTRTWAPRSDRISPQLRVVLQATILDGLSTREAATVLGIPQGTVKTRLARARAAMREELS